MPHLEFLIWALGFPLVQSVSNLTWWFCNGRPAVSDTPRDIAGVLVLAFYLFIAYHLW